MTTYVFLVDGMHCGSCALLIDDALDDLAGVRGTETSKKTGLTRADLDTTVTTPMVRLAIVR
ncbi:cation transporter [Nocardia sp. NBC_01388]|uniref:cation transporter n=1 Tax=Nocardia sp. NBC_01388 TaxID=2903596 RepID=UPI00324573BF